MKAVDHFLQKTPPSKFQWVLNTPLSVDCYSSNIITIMTSNNFYVNCVWDCALTNEHFYRHRTGFKSYHKYSFNNIFKAFSIKGCTKKYASLTTYIFQELKTKRKNQEIIWMCLALT